jgi:hypothetical protein
MSGRKCTVTYYANRILETEGGSTRSHWGELAVEEAMDLA